MSTTVAPDPADIQIPVVGDNLRVISVSIGPGEWDPERGAYRDTRTLLYLAGPTVEGFNAVYVVRLLYGYWGRDREQQPTYHSSIELL